MLRFAKGKRLGSRKGKNRGWREHKEGVKREAFSGFVETPEYNARLGAEEGKGSKERGAEEG